MKYARHGLLHQFIMLSAVICCIVCTVFCAMLFYVRGYALRSSRQVLENLHSQTLLRLEEYFTSIEDEAYVVCYSSTLQDYINLNDAAAQIDMSDSLRSLHSGAYLIVDSLIGIAVFDPEGDMTYSSKTSLFTQDGLPEALTQITFYHYTKLFTADTAPEISRDCFAMLSPVYAMLPGNRLLGDRVGTLVFTLSTDHLLAILKSGGTADQVYLVLTDAEDNVIAASSNAAASYHRRRLFEADPPAALLDSGLSPDGWRLYGYLPHSFLNEDMSALLFIVAVTGITFLGLLILLILMLRQKILRPISRLSGFMARVPADEQPVRFESHANNELGEMIHIMNRMLDDLEQKNSQLRSSEAKMYAMELSRKDMEILAYRNQINPHFLYNTLDCICSIAMYHGADDVARISESLSTMFRYAVKGGNFALVAQEITYVQEYASIIGYRFMNRISIHVEASPEALRQKTIRLLIQPLVENAVFHGLERQVGPGNVYVSVSLNAEGCLQVSVQDDGIGISGEALAALQESILEAQSESPASPASEKSIGLRNIARRLHLYYGEAGSIRITSTEGAGTTVTVILPTKKGGASCIKS
ncbi:MAG TPA: sensor histidine kinase [Candidatus Eisenbergiella merdavium]|uniref:histidine kinase n=1 Tax=Candidatus Eisenbergiella merdavium TaxID=2838551 RepID=A0A9D2SSS4_9FIRM|nr:sensor histidine kinase [Candidatus Eisenbergiella merdavium]